MAENENNEEASNGNKVLKQVAKKSTSALPNRGSSADIQNGRLNGAKSSVGDVVANVPKVGLELSSNGDNSHDVQPKESMTNGRCSSKTNYRSDENSDADSDDVVVLSDTDVDKVDVRFDRTKRSLDTAVGNSVSSVNKKVCLEKSKSDKEKKFFSRKAVTDLCSEFKNMEVESWKTKVKELEQKCDKWKDIALDLQRQLDEIRSSNGKDANTTLFSLDPMLPNTSQGTSDTKPFALAKAPPPILRSISTPSALYVPRLTKKPNVDLPPNMLPPASTRLALQGSGTISSSASQIDIVDSDAIKSVIDLTDDDGHEQAMQPLPVSHSHIRTTNNFRPASIAPRPASVFLNPVGVALVQTAAGRPTAIQTGVPSPVQALPLRLARQISSAQTQVAGHPAPLPFLPLQHTAPSSAKRVPTRPSLKLSRVSQGIVLSWNMLTTDDHEPAATYQLFAYQQGYEAPTSTLWKKVGTVEALPLPMACTLTQFQVGNQYHFAVRAVDIHGRPGAFSEPGTIHLEALSSS